MSVEDQKKWELDEMSKPIDLSAASISIDPAPFQLVEKTSILKVHSLFSMVGINHAYVTKIGRLVGVVALKEVSGCGRFSKGTIRNTFNVPFVQMQLRKAIEDVNSGNQPVAGGGSDEIDAQPPQSTGTSTGNGPNDSTTTNGVGGVDGADITHVQMLSEKESLAEQEGRPLLVNRTNNNTSNTINNNNINNNTNSSTSRTSGSGVRKLSVRRGSQLQLKPTPQQQTIDETIISSIESSVSNSDNCSDIELQFIDDVPTPATSTSTSSSSSATSDAAAPTTTTSAATAQTPNAKQ